MQDSELDVLDYLGVSVFVVDVSRNGGYVYRKFNRVNAELSGRDPATLVGKSPREIFPERISDTLVRNFRRVRSAGKPLTYEIVLPYPTGERRLRTTLAPVIDESGVTCQLIGSSIDITQQHAEIVAQLQLDVQSQELTREMEQFVSMAAHDLRSPMRNIQQLAEVLRDDFVDHGDGKMELIDLLVNVAQSGSELLSDVLSYSRSREMVTASSDPAAEFDFGLVCSNIFAVLDPREEHRLSGACAQLVADEVVVQIVLRNLVDNAIKHGGRKPVSVSIDVERLTDSMLGFRVRDDGTGMKNPAAAFLESGEFDYDSGFGLLGIRQLVTARGGEISARTPADGSGTVFRFSLPGTFAATG